MLDGGVDSILLPPFGGLGDEMPPIIPFLHLRLKLFVAVRVDSRGICDGLGCGINWYRCVGGGGRHCLGRNHDEAIEDIGSNSQSLRVFVAVFFISLCSC